MLPRCRTSWRRLVALVQARLTAQTNFKDGGGKVYMTSPTKEVYRILMRDFVRMRCVARTRRD